MLALNFTKTLVFFYIFFIISYPSFPDNYIGSKKCASCHEKEFRLWEKSKHARSDEALIIDKKNFTSDQNCILCHYTDVKANLKNYKIKNVGCEACHGAGSAYASNEIMKNKEKLAKTSFKKAGEKICRDCHSGDSPNLLDFNLVEKWSKIKH